MIEKDINKANTLRGQLVLASDVHMQRVDDERGQLLIDLIRRIDASHTEVFLLNGDIFDFCFGQSPYYRIKFQALGKALEDLAAAGTRVVFVEGNHEFWMDAIGWRGVEIVKDKDLLLTFKDGARIRITHGDQIIHDPWYAIFRRFVKSRFAASLARLVPGRWLDAYTLKHAQVSRAQDKYRTLHHQRILGAFADWLNEGSVDHGVIGHFHVPYAENRPEKPGLMVSVDSWDRPNALIFDQGAFGRVYLTAVGAPFVRSSVKSVMRP